MSEMTFPVGTHSGKEEERGSSETISFWAVWP